MNKRHRVPIVLLAGVCAATFLMSCELGVNPLVFDGSPVRADIAVITTGALYDYSTTIYPRDIVSGIDRSVDSITVINITLSVDHLSKATSASTTISGSGSLDGNQLLSLTNVPLSTFLSERSIFDPAVSSAGLSYNSAGVRYLNNMLKDPAALPASVTVNVQGSAGQTGVSFEAHLRLYTQVFLKN